MAVLELTGTLENGLLKRRRNFSSLYAAAVPANTENLKTHPALLTNTILVELIFRRIKSYKLAKIDGKL